MLLNHIPRILVFAPCFVPYMASENICNGKLALAFLERGWRVDVISRKDDEGFLYSAEWKEPWLALRSVTHEIRYEVGSWADRLGDILRQWARLGHPVSGLRWAGRAYDLALELHAKEPYDVVMSRCPAEVGHLPAMKLAEKTGLPWLANWNDPPATYWPPPYRYGGGVISRWLTRRYVRKVVSRATVNTFPCERLMKYTLAQLGSRPDERAMVVPHIGLPARAFDVPRKDGRFKLCHAGHLCPEQDPAIFFAGIKRFLESAGTAVPFTLELIGDENPRVQMRVKEAGLDSLVRFTGPLPFEESVRHMAESDALLVLEAPYREGVILPSKVVECAQTGRPILSVAPEEGTMSDLLKAHGGGLVADGRSPEKIAATLTILFESWRKGTLLGRYGSSRLFHQFVPERVAGLYEDVFRRLGVLK